jgi:hypothetical protein
MTETTYRNPWHKPFDASYGPALYRTAATPRPYRGYLIYERVPGSYDVVSNGTCITQRAGLNGAKRFIDQLLDGPSDYFTERAMSYAE